MPSFIGNAQLLVLFVLWLAGAAVVGFALVDAIRQPAQKFAAVSARLSKPVWLAILGVAALLVFLAFPVGILSIFGIVSVVAGTVYVVDTRVKLRQIGPGSSGGGPYGGW